MSPSKRLPAFKAIEALVVAAQASSFTEAATALNITVAAVSRRIQGLETELGIQLFQRNHHTLRLTGQGEAYVSDIAPALEMIRDASERFRTRGRRQYLRVSVPPSFAASWLVPRLPKFHAQYQRVEVDLDTAIGPVDLDHSDVDLAVRIGTGNCAGVRATRLLDIDCYPVCSKDYLRNNRIRAMRDVLNFPLLGSKIHPELWTEWLHAAGINDEPAVRYAFDNFHLLYRAAINGLGIAIGLDVVVNPYLDEGQLVRLFDHPHKLSKGYYVICRPTDRTRRPVCTFRDWLIAEAAGSPSLPSETTVARTNGTSQEIGYLAAADQKPLAEWLPRGP